MLLECRARGELYDTDTELRGCRHKEKERETDAKRRVAELCRVLTAEYVMSVLRTKALITEEAVVECIVKRDFVNKDAGMLLPSKRPEVPKPERSWWNPFG